MPYSMPVIDLMTALMYPKYIAGSRSLVYGRSNNELQTRAKVLRVTLRCFSSMMEPVMLKLMLTAVAAAVSRAEPMVNNSTMFAVS